MRWQELSLTFSQVLIQHDAKVTHQLLLAAGLHDDSNASDEVSGLLPHLGALVVEPPLDCPADLREVWLHALPQGIDHGAKPVEHHVGVVTRLQLRQGYKSILRAHREAFEEHIEVTLTSTKQSKQWL